MADWLLPSNASYLNSWVADLGPYIGPWPLLPTGVTTGYPDTGWEVDFWVCLPNPAAPDDASQILDSSYDTVAWNASRNDNSFGDPTVVPQTEVDYLVDYFGTGSDPAPPIPSSPPPGYHIYVVYYPYNGGTRPTITPESLVSPNYSAQGKATFETSLGHWSDLQPEETHSTTINGTTVNIPTGSGAYYGPPGNEPSQTVDYTGYPGTSALEPIIQLFQQNFYPPSTSTGQIYETSTGDIGGSNIAYSISRNAATGTNPSDTSAFSVDAALSVWKVDINAEFAERYFSFTPAPQGLNSLVYGVDYEYSPYDTSYSTDNAQYEYVSDTYVSYSWGSMNVHVTAQLGVQNILESFSISGTPSATTRVDMLSDTALSVDQLPPGGTTLYSNTVTLANNGDTLDTLGALDLSSAGLSFVLAFGPTVLFADSASADVGAVDVPPPPAGSGLTTYGYSFAVRSQLRNRPTFTWVAPQWRYWVPGKIVPVAPTAIPLRLTQRTDGIGVVKHARIRSTGQVTSAQFRTTARINFNNQYR